MKMLQHRYYIKRSEPCLTPIQGRLTALKRDHDIFSYSADVNLFVNIGATNLPRGTLVLILGTGTLRDTRELQGKSPTLFAHGSVMYEILSYAGVFWISPTALED